MKKLQVVYLAGGCYWGMEELFRNLPGVIDTKVGFCGGHIPNVAYREVTTGTTGHAETLMVTFDEGQTTLRHLLFEFFRIHNPTKINQQGNDIGTQYRSAIFYTDSEQRRIAEEVISSVNDSNEWIAPVVTEVTPFNNFYPAEEKHQKYIMKFPEGYTCHFRRNFNLGEHST
ncbi:MAG: Peptide methionine sulfoxide reductase MsrA 3 [Bacteroidota bacterium]|jgi:peptide-methionine (S)-S-oxide reductase